MTFATPDGERVTTSGVADKTARIALVYQSIADDHNEEILRELLKQYHTQKSEIDLLEFCISLLEPRLSEIITDMFINKMTWAETAEKHFVSLRMIGKYRQKGITELCKMYDMRRDAAG